MLWQWYCFFLLNLVVVDNAVFDVDVDLDDVFGFVLGVVLAAVFAVTVVVKWLLIVDLRIKFQPSGSPPAMLSEASS